MKLELPPRINRQQWLQRMGVYGKPDIDMLMQLSEAEEKLFSAAMPQGIYRIMPVEAITPQGEDIKKHLRGCSEIALLGVTLGAMVDNLIRVSQIRDMAEAVMIDCGASVLAERLCDDLEERIHKETKQFMTSRYSPGYGDYPLHMQSEIIWLMDGHRKIGLTINKNHIMVPQKSITGIIGLSERPVTGHLANCDACIIKEECVLRKEGKNCAGL